MTIQNKNKLNTGDYYIWNQKPLNTEHEHDFNIWNTKSTGANHIHSLYYNTYPAMISEHDKIEKLEETVWKMQQQIWKLQEYIQDMTSIFGEPSYTVFEMQKWIKECHKKITENIKPEKKKKNKPNFLKDEDFIL